MLRELNGKDGLVGGGGFGIGVIVMHAFDYLKAVDKTDVLVLQQQGFQSALLEMAKVCGING